MSVLVTGGDGFIGKAVVKELVNRGIEPYVFDRSTGGSDVRDSELIDRIVRQMKIGSVIHLAGVLGTEELFETPRHAIDVNVIGALNVLEACRRNGSGYVGITMPSVWMNMYQVTKRTAKDLATTWHREYEVPVSHVRAYNVFGPGQKVNGVQKIVPTFATKAWRNEDIPIWGDGEQTVDLVYVDDVAKMLVDATEYGMDQVFDAGTGAAWTVNQVAERVIEMTDSKSKLEHMPMRRGETLRTELVASGEGWDLLGWRPELQLRDLLDTVDWYKQDRP